MNTNDLGKDSITSLIIRFSIPSIIGMLVNAIYNIVDRIFIGNFAGESALASLMIVYPVILATFAASVLIGNGGANLIAIRLGEKNKKGAEKIFTDTLVLSIISAVVLATIALFNIDTILYSLGATDDVFTNAKTYLSIYLIFIPISITSYVLSTIVRAEGFPKLSMNAMIASAFTNIVLDSIFICVFNMGVKGAAIATVIGQSVGFVIYLLHFLRKKSNLQFQFKDMVPSRTNTKDIIIVGFPSFINILGLCISTYILDISLNFYGGVAAVTSMAAINSLYTVINMPISGIQNGVSPIIGYNHGAGFNDRAQEALKKALMIACSFGLIMFIIIETVPHMLLSLFISSGSDTMDIAIVGLRLFVLALPILGVNVISIGFFQATQKPKLAIGLGLLRQFGLLIPYLIILPMFLGLHGVWLATPCADLTAIFISIRLLRLDFKNQKQNKINN